MGVPKFFRWMSERYPAISQLIAENRIPEFDCLYLDMNGIIHNCTHKESDSASFRMTEDKMFIAIFNYIEHLFGKIKPKQLFFMAIDGVAPRAKMNQQRARRFRTALDAELAREKAIREGLEMPVEDAFDSNCITPGTEFMARLTQQLKYFISKKMSEDVDWQGVEVILSGHEVPGEGEHKIMEYIRQAKSQPGYDPNVRHCLYGLDADLIMLGLLSHDPHFCLLREEVTFGRQNQKKSTELEHQNFYLMHLSMVREYLELEFQELEKPGSLSFSFDMERVIDDFILMAFFVGNDFLPNLPHLHINEGALALMFETYKKVLPKAKGYINEGGVINLKRLGLLLDELSNVEYRFFEADNADASWMKSKHTSDRGASEPGKRKGQLVISTPQRDIWRRVRRFVNDRPREGPAERLDLPATLPASDRKFVEEMADSLHLQCKSVVNGQGDRHQQLGFYPKPEANDKEEDEEDEEDEEAHNALLRVIKRYDNAKVVDISSEQAQEEMERKYQLKFRDWKNKHYQSKLGWEIDNEEELRKLTENYVQGLQWVLYYYYRGVVSWPWFYGYHYSPMISDIKKGLHADMDFKLGQPFRPFQQLMGVLPDRSKKLVPPAYQDLMTDPNSPIIDFYPREFELDMNGKKMEWEAVVKIPFIDEARLLSAMAPRDRLLSDAERQRNDFGVTLKFTHSPDLDYTYPSSLPEIFPDLSHCKCIENIYELPTMEGLEVYVGLVDGVKLGAAALAGFPTLKTLPFTGTLGFHGVSVFQQESRNQSMVVTLLDSEHTTKVERAKARLGRSVYVGYPFLQEAKVVKVSDELFDYVLPNHKSAQVICIPHSPYDIEQWRRKADRIENVYSKRLAMIIGSVESLVHVQMLKGLKKTDDGATVKEYAEIPGLEPDYATQTIVDEVISQDQRFLEKVAVPIEEEFPEGTRAFFLGELAYGRPLEVIGHKDGKAEIWVFLANGKEADFGRQIAAEADRLTPYTPSFAVAKMLSLNPLVLSKLTSSFSVNSGSQRLNLGLNLKFEAKKLKVLGYTRKGSSGWEFSQKAIDLIQQYMVKFPEFIAGVQRNPQGNMFEDTDFYPANIAKEKMKEIGSWLKEIEAKTFERVPLEAQQLDSDLVSKIEQAADYALQHEPPPQGKKIGNVPRSALLNPAEAEQRIGVQRFTLGDRVVYVSASGRVPIASRGTVVGITQSARTTLLDIVFDNTFMSGTTLGGRCSAFRGSTVPITSVLNVTDRQVVAESRAAADRRPTANVQPLTVNGYGAPTMAGGRGHMVDAATPPPLVTSFRGAVSGQQRTSQVVGIARGREGGGGPGPSAQYQQQQQAQVPIRTGPPSVYTASTRGRGYANGFPHPQNQPNGHSTRQGQPDGFAPRGRGLGSPQPNRAGYTVVDNSDPMAGVKTRNPNFRPQSYTNVPPPATLNNARGRGLGEPRGMFRGRGRGTSYSMTGQQQQQQQQPSQ